VAVAILNGEFNTNSLFKKCGKLQLAALCARILTSNLKQIGGKRAASCKFLIAYNGAFFL
jgi:hypothetical protein